MSRSGTAFRLRRIPVAIAALASLSTIAAPLSTLTVTVHDEELKPASVSAVLSNDAGVLQEFMIDGSYDAQLVAGKYVLTANRHLEYRTLKRPITLTPGSHAEISLGLDRWFDPSAHGWISAERYSLETSPVAELVMIEAIQRRSLGPTIGHKMGHTVSHEDDLISDTGFTLQQAIAVDGILGEVDFIQTLGSAGLQAYYDFLNMGVKLRPFAGSEFPYIKLGERERVYVSLGRDQSSAAWLRGLNAGRNFATNGPLVNLSVDGNGPGEVLGVDRGRVVTVTASAKVDPETDCLSRLTLVGHGEAIEFNQPTNRSASLALNYDLTVDRGMWLVVHAQGQRSEAVSAPVYIVIKGGDGHFADRRKGAELAAKYLETLDTVAKIRAGKESTAMALPSTTGGAKQRIKRARRAYQALR